MTIGFNTERVKLKKIAPPVGSTSLLGAAFARAMGLSQRDLAVWMGYLNTNTGGESKYTYELLSVTADPTSGHQSKTARR